MREKRVNRTGNMKNEALGRLVHTPMGLLGASYGVMKDDSASQGWFHGSLSHKVPQTNFSALRSLSKVV